MDKAETLSSTVFGGQYFPMEPLGSSTRFYKYQYKKPNVPSMLYACEHVPLSSLDAFQLHNLQKEAVLLESFNSPHIVQLQEVIITNDTFNIITEYCNGGSL